jgi:hypothetical protein
VYPQLTCAVLLVAMAGTACTDYVFDQAPAGCGFPSGSELAFGGLASPLELGIDGAPIDRTTRIEAYVTEEPVELTDGTSGRAICLVLIDDGEVDYWVRPVAADWEYPGE